MRFTFFFALVLTFLKLDAEPVHEKDSLLRAGYAQMYKGQFEIAGKMFLEALSNAQSKGDKLIEAESFRLLGELNRASGNREFSIKYLDKAEQKFNEIGNEYGMASTKNRKAATYLEDTNYPKCLKYVESSIIICRKYNFKDLLYNNLTILGAYQNYVDSNYIASKHTLLEALSIAIELNEVMDYPYIYNNISRVYEKLNLWDSALVMALKSYEIALQYDVRSYISFASGHLSIIYAAKGDYKNAWQYERVYNQYRDTLLAETKTKAISDLVEAYQAEKNENLIAKQRWEFKFLAIFTSVFFALLALLIIFNIKLSRSGNKLNETNRKLELNQLELESLNALKDRLLTVLSHDLRSPVATLQSALDLINNQDLSAEETNAIMSEMGIRIERTGQLLDNLLVWIKNQVKSIEPIPEILDINRLISESLDLMDPEIRLKQLQIVLELDNNLKLLADKEMMKLVIRNLLSNAVKFSRKGQSISWSSGTTGNEIYLSVTDEGIGIAPEKIEDIFSMKKVSTTGTNDEIGMGLGLSVVRDFVSQNGGKLKVISEKNVGTTFTILFPKS